MWSHMKKPAQLLASASTARDTMLPDCPTNRGWGDTNLPAWPHSRAAVDSQVAPAGSPFLPDDQFANSLAGCDDDLVHLG